MEKKKALEMAISQIEKQFGKGSIMKLGEESQLSIESISTGSIGLDIALGIGGVPKGRIVEIFGPESSGKTTIALHAIAEVQRNGGYAAFIDAEHSLSPHYAEKLGVNTEELFVSQPTSGEEALDIANMLIDAGVDIVVVDSVAALVPRAEIEGEMGDAHVGLQARLMSQAMRKLTGSANRSQSILLFINQLREKVGIVFGNPEVTPGGRALKFYASVRLEVRRKEQIKKGDSIIGALTRVKVVKNKVSPPFKEVSFDLIYGEGVSKEGSIIDLAVEKEIIKKSGAWYSYKGEQIGQGRENAKAFLAENPKIYQEIEDLVREQYLLG